MACFVDGKFILTQIKHLRCLIPKRHRMKLKWATTQPKQPPTRLALQHFDATYPAQLGALWPSVRVALLSERKYGALLNNFCHDEDLASWHSLPCRDFISDAQSVDSKDSTARLAENQGEQCSPKIKCQVFPRGDVTRFRSARPDSQGLLVYYLLDAASVLPCLALDVREGHTVLDLCAAPGGKTLALLQTQIIRFLCINDLSVSRTSRLRKVLHSYVPKHLLTEERIRITSLDGTKWGEMERNTYDRVLVDVPCTTDRHSLMEEENNVFSKQRGGERLRLPELQLKLLLAGILAACPGGEVVYSTCTLSKNQNQAVVSQAIQFAEENYGIILQEVSLQNLTHIFSETFQFGHAQPLGLMVVPHLTANFGPTYLCKLRRLS